MTVSRLSIASFDIRSYLYAKFLNPFVYSISKLDWLLLHNDVAGLFFALFPRIRSQLACISPKVAIFAPHFGSRFAAP
jgi:hypothetical protein